MLAYCYVGRWLYLEACVLLPEVAPYLQSTLEALDPPTHDRIIEMIESHSIPESLDRGIENLKPNRRQASRDTSSVDDLEELSEDYF